MTIAVLCEVVMPRCQGCFFDCMWLLSNTSFEICSFPCMRWLFIVWVFFVGFFVSEFLIVGEDLQGRAECGRWRRRKVPQSPVECGARALLDNI